MAPVNGSRRLDPMTINKSPISMIMRGFSGSPSLAAAMFCLLVVSALSDHHCDDDLSNKTVGVGSDHWWSEWRQAFHSNVERATKQTEREPRPDLVFYGDSITNGIIKTGGIEYYNDFTNTEVFGVRGDKAENLLYRLRNGEFPDKMKPKVVVVTIGTNNIRDLVRNKYSSGMSSLEVKTEAERIVRDIRQIAAFLHRKSCSTTIILQAVLPSADQYNNIWPNRYSKMTKAVNRKIKDFASQYDMLRFVDCSRVFLEDAKFMKDKQVFIEDRMDSMLIHPSIDGHRHLAKCLIPEIKDRKS